MFEIYIDFDGTITNCDSIVALTDRFGAGREFRLEVVRKIERGEIDVFECIRQELGTVTAGWEEALAFLLEKVQVDPELGPFLDWCRERGYPACVVSSGIERVVRFFLKDFPGLPIFAHPVEFRRDGWVYRKEPEKDKRVVLSRGSLGRRVFIGDGLSDIAAIPHADYLFAKRRLQDYCRSRGIAYFPFDNLRHVRDRLEAIEAERTFIPRSPGRPAG